jgi:hypothetical protein
MDEVSPLQRDILLYQIFHRGPCLEGADYSAPITVAPMVNAQSWHTDIILQFF